MLADLLCRDYNYDVPYRKFLTMINSSKVQDERFWSKWEEAGAVGWVGVPPRCNHVIFTQGESIAALDARKDPAERWVRLVARRANAKLDWHYSGGVVHVLHLGDADSRERVTISMRELEGRLRGTLMQVYEAGEPGLYRKGVTPVPEGAIASWMDPNTGQAVYAVA